VGLCGAISRESNAILEYVVERYDKEKKYTVTGDDLHVQRQWLYFQVTFPLFLFFRRSCMKQRPLTVIRTARLKTTTG
jgi:glutathione S-transferase